eukprot:6453936-Alexandrium_andersonii.AAC.1
MLRTARNASTLPTEEAAPSTSQTTSRGPRPCAASTGEWSRDRRRAQAAAARGRRPQQGGRRPPPPGRGA